MFWTLIFAFIIITVVAALLWARGIRYRTGLHIHLRLKGAEQIPILTDKGEVRFRFGETSGTLYKGSDGVIQISYGDTEEELRWMRGYRFSRNDKAKLRVIGTTRSNRLPYRRFIVIGAAAGVLLAGGVFFGWRCHRLSQLFDSAVAVELEHSGSGEVFTDSDMTNILIAVTDGDGSPDMLKIASFNRRNKSLKLISLMGDTLVDADGVRCRLRETGKNRLSETVESSFYIHIDEYLEADFTCVTELIDRLGGVDLTMTLLEVNAVNQLLRQEYGEDCEEIPVERYFPANYEVREAEIHCCGKQALCYGRIETGSAEGSDRSRSLRQGAVMEELVSGGNAARLLMFTSRFGGCAERVITSLRFRDIGKLALDTASYWRNYKDSYGHSRSLMLPASYEELWDTSGERSLYTYPGSVRQSVFRILYYDMEG